MSLVTQPAVSYALLGVAGEVLAAYGEHREYYAASTVKLAVAAALLLRVDQDQLTLENTVASTNLFASRIREAPPFTMEPDEIDPGMPAAGEAVTLAWCLERMLVVSSNEATNLLANILGFDAINDAAALMGAPDVSMTRLICDYEAREAGFSHTATAGGLARLMWHLCCDESLSSASRALIIDLLHAQRFPIISAGLPADTKQGSKSGWDDGIRHDVAFIGEPGTPGFRVLAICTEGFTPLGAHEVIAQLARAMHPAK